MLGWFRKLLPHEDKFFDLFALHAETIAGAAGALNALLRGENREDNVNKIFDLENRADEVTREVLLAVRRSFITPFDRTDIKDLIQSMDDTIDMMRKTVKTILLFETESFDEGMQEIGGDIVRAAYLLTEAVGLLKMAGANAGRLSAIAEEMTRVEGHSDDVHEAGLKALFRAYGHTSTMSFLIGREVYGELEKVLDRFEDVAKEISGIVLENV